MLYPSANHFIAGSALFIRGVTRIRAAVQSRFARLPKKSEIRSFVEPRRLGLAEQWGHLSDTITQALSRAEEATRCHTSAALQLDLAQYALTSLVDELAAVMDVGGRRQRATVHIFDVQPPPVAPRPFGDAIAA